MLKQIPKLEARNGDWRLVIEMHRQVEMEDPGPRKGALNWDLLLDPFLFSAFVFFLFSAFVFFLLSFFVFLPYSVFCSDPFSLFENIFLSLVRFIMWVGSELLFYLKSRKDYQSIHQSINRSINQSINLSIYQSIFLSINQSINKSINK